MEWKVLIGFIILGGCVAASIQQDLCHSSCLCGYNMHKNSKTHYTIDCSENELDKLPSLKQLPKHFDELDVSQNNIRSLTKGTFTSPTLKMLMASHNQMDTISPEFLKRVPNLKWLDLSHNKLKQLDPKLFEGAAGLHHLDISFNLIATLPDTILRPLKALKFLDISYNNVGNYVMKLKNLNDPKLGITNDLTSLKMNRVNITELPLDFFTNTSLRFLTLDDNQLHEIPKLPYTIEYLDLSGNYFKELNVRHLNYHKLKKLRLTRLPLLEKIEKYAFYNLQDLEHLHIENCPRLVEFNDLAFGVLLDEESFELKSVSLSGNGLSRLNFTYFHLFNKLDKVDLSNNPWNCDCDILWFKLLKNKVTNKANTRCASPSKLISYKILELTDRQLPKCVVGSGWTTHKVLVSIISVLCVMLVVIIAYLIYLGPFKSGIRNKFVGAESPYNSVVIREDQY